MKQDAFQAEVLARFELLDQRMGQVDQRIRALQDQISKESNSLQDQIVNLASAFARAGIHLEEKP